MVNRRRHLGPERRSPGPTEVGPGPMTRCSVLVGTEVEVVEGYGLATGAEVVVVGVVTGDGVRRGAGLLGGLHPDAAVALQAGPGRDELTDDDVLLQTAQRVR